MSHGLIDPSKLPGHNLDLAGVSQAAADISSRAGSIQQGGTDVASSWSTLPASYESTGAEAVYVAMNPVRDASDRVGGDLTAVASALTDWVTTVQPILTRLADLRSDAEAFVVEANTFQSRVTSTGNLAVAFLPVQVDNWWEDPDMVQRNADFVDQGYLLGEQLRVANEDLANAIRRSAGLSASTVAPAATSAPDDLQTDWGSASAREESCAEKTIGFPMHLTGGVLNGAWDMVGGLGMLVSGYDFKSWPPPAWGVLGDMLSGDLQGAADRGGDWLSGWGQSWLGLGHLVTGVSMGFMAPVMTEVVAPGQISDLKAKGVDTGFVEWQQQWMRDSYRSYIARLVRRRSRTVCTCVRTEWRMTERASAAPKTTWRTRSSAVLSTMAGRCSTISAAETTSSARMPTFRGCTRATPTSSSSPSAIPTRRRCITAAGTRTRPPRTRVNPCRVMVIVGAERRVLPTPPVGRRRLLARSTGSTAMTSGCPTASSTRATMWFDTRTASQDRGYRLRIISS